MFYQLWDNMRLLELLNEDEQGTNPKKHITPRVQEPKNYGTARALSGEVAAAIPNARVVSQLRNTDTYMQYRYGIALAAAAASQGEEFEQESAWSENVGLVGYTDADMETIKRADKLMGVTGENISGSGSYEQTDVNTKSAISGQENA
jgi:hypothetical protein